MDDPLTLKAGRNRDFRPKDDFDKARHPLPSVDDACRVDFKAGELQLRKTRNGSEGEEKTHLDRSQQEVLGTPGISRAVILNWRRATQLGDAGREDLRMA
ncbi:MAG TPA: hypothetical protein VH701_24585 [Vicinamibacterales bacterium]|jgi:hypothetical protein